MGIEPSPDGAFRWRRDAEVDPVVAAFHAVRRMTYGSTGSRDPADLVRDRRGACTAKHLLLAQLLSSLDVPCRVRCVAGAFGKGLPEAEDMPEELRSLIHDGGVPDVHNVVQAKIDGADVLLDATWNDALIPVGFPVNHAWSGVGDTTLALEGDMLEEDGVDALTLKTRRLAALPLGAQERRQRFLTLITQYSAARQSKGGGA